MPTRLRPLATRLRPKRVQGQPQMRDKAQYLRFDSRQLICLQSRRYYCGAGSGIRWPCYPIWFETPDFQPGTSSGRKPFIHTLNLAQPQEDALLLGWNINSAMKRSEWRIWECLGREMCPRTKRCTSSSRETDFSRFPLGASRIPAIWRLLSSS